MTTTGLTAAWDVQVALATALQGAASLAALVPLDTVRSVLAVYNGQAPEDAPSLAVGDFGTSGYRDGRVIIGEPTEGAFRTFMRGGADGTLSLHIYTADPSSYQALRIFTALVGLLDGVPLSLGNALAQPVAQNMAAAPTLTLVTSFVDPASHGRHLVARYAYQTVAVA